jgi:hypothetical protein
MLAFLGVRMEGKIFITGTGTKGNLYFTIRMPVHYS